MNGMRLIDADAINFSEVFGGQSDFAKDLRKAAQELIDKQPTAFYKEKVIEKINEKSDYARDRWLNQTKEGYSKYWDGKENGLIEALEIVEKGGIG